MCLKIELTFNRQHNAQPAHAISRAAVRLCSRPLHIPELGVLLFSTDPTPSAYQPLVVNPFFPHALQLEGGAEGGS